MRKVVHFEIPADNLERAKKFYSIFGWKLQDWPMDDGSIYVGISTVEVDENTSLPKEPGSINGGLVKRDEFIQTPQVTVNVPSIDEYIAMVKEAGGSLVMPRQKIENMGYFAYVKDTEGNLLGLWEDMIQDKP
jgi:uncharacterized protein